MNGTVVIRQALEQYRENELILVSKLYREKLAGFVSEPAFYKALERMCKSGELSKIAKGVYYRPKVGKYGTVPPSEREIVLAFTENETGMEIGYTLYNALNLTTQVPKTVTVLSSALEGFSKSIRNVVIERQELQFTEPVKNMVGALEVFQNFSQIQDISYSGFLTFTKAFAKNFSNEAFEEVNRTKKYQKSTIAFAQEVLRHYEVENGLSKHLSTLSTYKHPRMEEIYAAAHIQ